MSDTVERSTARSFLGVDDVSHGWNSGDGELWMDKNCRRCVKSRDDGSVCLLENWLWFGGVPTHLNGFGLTFEVYEGRTTQMCTPPVTTWHGTWNCCANVPDECPQREEAKP